MRKRLFYESKNVLNSNEGYILINVVLIFLVVLIIIASLSATSVHNHKQALKQRNHSAAYYYAEGGLNEFYTYLSENSNLITHDDLLTYLENNVLSLVKTESELIDHQAIRTLNIEEISSTELKVSSSVQVLESSCVLEQIFQFPCHENLGNHDGCRPSNLIPGPIREVR